MNIKNITKLIPDILLAQLACFSMVYGLISSLCLPCPVLKIVILSIAGVLVFTAAFYNRKVSIVSCSIIGLFLISSCLFIVFRIGFNDVISFVSDYFYWLDSFIVYPHQDIYDPLFADITVYSLAVFLSLYSYFFVIKKFNFYIIAGTGIVMFAVQSSLGYISSYVPFYIFLLLSFLFYIKHVYRKRVVKDLKNSDLSGIAAILSIPVCILIIGCSALLDKSEKPIEWKWMDEKVNSVYNYIRDKFDYEVYNYFSLSKSTGFGGKNNTLGGRVKLDDKKVLRVKTVKNVYLKGITRDIYTGRSWISSQGKNEFNRSLNSSGTNLYNDTYEMLAGMIILTGRTDFLDEYFYPNKVTVTFENIKTKSLFLPSKTFNFSTAQGGFRGMLNNMGDLSSVKRESKGFKYYAEVYVPNIGSAEFADVMRKSREGLYHEYMIDMFKKIEEKSQLEQSIQLERRIIRQRNNNTTGNSSDSNIHTRIPGKAAEALINSRLEQIKKELSLIPREQVLSLIQNSANAYENYLQLPESLPQRVKDLAISLTAPYDNNYDKARAIEKYLSSNYPYNLDVRSTPRNRDFVDYFLFDLKEGYCSYYATAMAILARCAGIPSRYVEGYILPPETENGEYLVTNMQAHAWVELYFEGYGWLPFEPTAPFTSIFYRDNTSKATYSENYSSYYNEYMEMMKRYDENQVRDYDDIEYTIPVENDTQKSLFVPITLIILLAVIALLLVNAFRHKYKLYRMFNLPAKGCILSLYRYYISVLSLRRMPLKPGETPYQYGSRVDSVMYFDNVRFRNLSEIFVKARYSNNDINENEKQVFLNFYPVFMKVIKSDIGKFNYFVQKYILGRI